MYNGTMQTQIPVTITFEYEQIKAIVDQMPEDEKEQLAAYLDRQTVVKRIERFQALAAGRGLSDEEIDAEVQTVRKDRATRAHRH